MAQNQQGNNDGGGNQVNNALKFTGIAFQMIFIIALFTFAGYKADEAAGHQTKWVTAILALAGVFISLFLVIRSLKN